MHMSEITDYLRKIGKRGGEKTRKRGRDYYRQIGRKGLAKRYKKSALDPDQKKRDLFIPEPRVDGGDGRRATLERRHHTP
jgi:hypothetical protein